jgi:hypothetical protein
MQALWPAVELPLADISECFIPIGTGRHAGYITRSKAIDLCRAREISLYNCQLLLNGTVPSRNLKFAEWLLLS